LLAATVPTNAVKTRPPPTPAAALHWTAVSFAAKAQLAAA